MKQSPPSIVSNMQIQHAKPKAFREPQWTRDVTTPLAAIAQERRNTVLAFLQHMKACGAGMRRLESCALAIRTIEILNRDYMGITRKDLERWVVYLESEYKPSTVNLFKITIKQFFKWLYIDDDDSKEYPAVVKWIKVGKIKANYGKQVLSKQQVLAMMECTDNPRDRAIIHVLYESGCRASELLGMNMRDINFDQYGAVARVSGKTGDRRVRLIESIPDLRLYLDHHPNKNGPEGALWTDNRRPYEVLKKIALQHLIYRIAEHAGLPKGISPHSFRHARATHLASDLTEAQMKVLFGWTGESDMPARYVHLSGKDVDDALLRINGIKIETQDKALSPTAPKPCPRCHTQNGPAAKFCMACSSPLDTKTVLEIEQRTTKAEEITAKVIESIIQKAPDLVAAVLREQGLVSDIQKVASVYKSV